VLSTHTRNKAKAKKTGTYSMVEEKSNTNIKPPSQELTAAPGGKIPTSEKEEEKNKENKEKEEEIKIDTSKVEPEEEELENPIRILPLQRKFMKELDNNDFEPIIHGRYSGFLMLKRKNPNVVSIYDEEEEKKRGEKGRKKRREKR